MIAAIINTIIDTDIEIIVDEIISAGKGLALHAGDAALAKKQNFYLENQKRKMK